MKKVFVSNLAFLVTLHVLVKGFYVFGIDVEMQNQLGTNIYGSYFALFNFAIVLQILLDVGIQNFNNRKVAQNHRLLSYYVSCFIPLKITLGVVYTLVCLTVGVALGFTAQEFKLLYLLIFNQFLASFILYFRSNISGLHLFKLDGFIAVSDKLLMIIVCAFLLYSKRYNSYLSVQAFILSQTFAYLITFALALLALLYKSGKIKLTVNLALYASLLRKTYPYALLIFLMFFYFRSDAVLIKKLLPDGNYHAGIYAQGFKLIDAFNQFAFIYGGLLLPIFSRMLAKKEDISQLLATASVMLFVPLIAGLLPGIFYSKQIIELLFDHSGAYPATVLSLLIISMLGYAFNYIFGALLTANGSLRVLNIIAMFAMIVNVSLNLYFIQRYHAIGAAAVSALTQWSVALAQAAMCYKIFKLRLNSSLLLRFVFLVILIAGLAYIGIHITEYWQISYALIVLVGLIVPFLIRLIKVKEVLTFISIRE